MAVKYPAFRKKFPLLVTGGLLALQPVATPLVIAAEQFACQPGADGGWNCAADAASPALPPRPTHRGAATETTSVQPRASKAERQAATTKLVTESKGRALASRSADYSHLDWVPRDQLTNAQLAETGPYCAGTYVEPNRPGQFDDTPMSEAPTYVSAKATRYEQQQEIATLAGDVVLRQGSIQAEADEASLYQLENRGELKGNVRLRDGGALMVGDRAELFLDTGEAQVENAEYVVHEGKVRGSALYAKRTDDAIIRLKDGTYTRCEPGDNDWYLQGNNVTLNPATGFGSATNVTLRVKGVPVFYTPYIYFPIDDRRQSGFLAPSISSSSDTGLSLITPYYFNLAPNFDATLYPNYMTDRGLPGRGHRFSRKHYRHHRCHRRIAGQHRRRHLRYHLEPGRRQAGARRQGRCGAFRRQQWRGARRSPGSGAEAHPHPGPDPARQRSATGWGDSGALTRTTD